ncbi:DNA polymerase epsilon catalytic subunit, partial [Coemansia aciculifera]
SKHKKQGGEPADSAAAGSALWGVSAASSSGNVPVSTFQLLRSLLRGWCQEVEERQNPFAEMMTEHFYRWLTRPNSSLYDPALAYLVRSLMRKVFLQMKAECRKLGAKIIYASLDKLVVTTGKASVVAAQAAVDYIAKAIVAKPLFENISLMPLQYWTFLLWMNSSNYGGIVIQDAGGEGGASGEPSIEMLWNMKEYLPPLVQSQFELIVAEFIYKLAGFHAQLRAKNPHIAHSSGDAAMHNEVIEDDDEETEKTGNSSSVTAAKGTFYKRLIGQYFTRKLLEAVPQIRDACSPAQQRHHDNPQACFPRLPGSTLHLPG